MTKQMHRQICDELSETMRLDRERRRIEMERIARPSFIDHLIGWIFAVVAVTGTVLILLYVKN